MKHGAGRRPRPTKVNEESFIKTFTNRSQKTFHWSLHQRQLTTSSTETNTIAAATEQGNLGTPGCRGHTIGYPAHTFEHRQRGGRTNTQGTPKTQDLLHPADSPIPTMAGEHSGDQSFYDFLIEEPEVRMVLVAEAVVVPVSLRDVMLRW